MPFISQERRFLIASGDPAQTVGDRCYIHYKEMVRQWRETPRWTTAHNLYKQMRMELPVLGDCEEAIAYDLAWQVFFIKYVWPYEQKMIEKNGDIL